MKKTFVIGLIVLFLMSTSMISCGDKKEIGDYTYDTYGFINKGEKRNPDIEYRLIIGNIGWSVILAETVIAPIYFWGFSIYEPVGERNENAPIGTVN